MSEIYGAMPADWQHFSQKLGLTGDLLPVVSNPHTRISSRSKLKELGKVPSQLNREGYVSGFSGWTSIRTVPADIDDWKCNPDYGICVQTRTVRGLDIDIDDRDISHKVVETVERIIGALPRRYRKNSGKCLLALLLRGDDMRKRVIHTAHGKIEFLGTGQHFVAVGTHPSGVKYQWSGGLPAEIPEVSQEQFERIWAALQDQYGVQPPVTDRVGHPGTGSDVPYADDDVATYLDKHGWTISKGRKGHRNIRCPWEGEHSTGEAGDTSTRYLVPGGSYFRGHFKCLHSACTHRPDDDFLHAIGFEASLFEELPPLTPDEEREQKVVRARNAGHDCHSVGSHVKATTATSNADSRAAYPPPFRGVMSDIVTSALSVSYKPQGDLCTLSALVGMASSCSGIYSLPSGMRLNLFGCGVAGTGEGKDLPRTTATSICKAAGGEVIGKPASGPGLEDCLVSYTGTLIALDEIAHFFAAINSGKAAPHLIELAGTLLQLFSVSRGNYYTRVRAKASGTVPSRLVRNPVVSLLGFATPEKLGEAMGVSNIEDGLLGRFFFAFGQEGVTPRRIHDSWALPISATEAADAIRRTVSLELLTADKDVDCIQILTDPTAEAHLEKLMREFDRQRLAATSAFAKALLARSFEKCERVAGVLAVWDSPDTPAITLEHVMWAEQLVFASDAALLRFSGEYMHGGQTQANAQRVLKLIKRAVEGDFKPQKRHEMEMTRKGIAPYTMVMRNSKLAKRDFDDAVAHLVDLGEVKLVTMPSQHPNGRGENVRGLVMSI